MSKYESDPLYQEILEQCDGDEILAVDIYEETMHSYYDDKQQYDDEK